MSSPPIAVASADEVSAWRATAFAASLALLLGALLYVCVLLEPALRFRSEPYVMREVIVEGAVKHFAAATGMVVSLIFALAFAGMTILRGSDAGTLRFRRRLGDLTGALVAIEAVVAGVALLGLLSQPRAVVHQWWVFPVALVACALGIELSRFVGRPPREKLVRARARLDHAETVLDRCRASDGVSLPWSFSIACAVGVLPTFIAVLATDVPLVAMLVAVILSLMCSCYGVLVAVASLEDSNIERTWMTVLFRVSLGLLTLQVFLTYVAREELGAAVVMSLAAALPAIGGMVRRDTAGRWARFTLANGVSAWRERAWAASVDEARVELAKIETEAREALRRQ